MVLALSTAGRKSAILQRIWDRVDFGREQIRLGVVGERNLGHSDSRITGRVDARYSPKYLKKAPLPSNFDPLWLN